MSQGKGKVKTAVGTLTLQQLDYTGTATLHTDRTWAFAGDAMVCHNLKNAAHLVDVRDHGPADGPFGPRQLEELRGVFGGEVSLAELPGEPDGTVY